VTVFCKIYIKLSQYWHYCCSGKCHISPRISKRFLLSSRPAKILVYKSISMLHTITTVGFT